MASATTHDDTDDRVTVLTFELEDDRYCVRADAVASVLGVTSDEAIATAADPWNAGSVTVGDERVRVVDLPRAFTSSVRTSDRVDEPKLLVFRDTDADDAYYGWLVDDVDVTRTVRASDLEPTRMGRHMPHVKGRLEIGDDDVVWLDERAIHG